MNKTTNNNFWSKRFGSKDIAVMRLNQKSFLITISDKETSETITVRRPLDASVLATLTNQRETLSKVSRSNAAKILKSLFVQEVETAPDMRKMSRSERRTSGRILYQVLAEIEQMKAAKHANEV